MDFIGIMSITAYLVFKHFGAKYDNEWIDNILILGLFCKMYRGIVSFSIIHPELMKGVKLLKNTIRDMGYFLIILALQVSLFTCINGIE